MSELQEAYKRDDIGDSITQIDLEHHEVHEGNHYTCQDDDSNVDIANPKYWRITTPNTTKRVHLVFRTLSSFPGTVELFENPTILGSGVALDIFNNDRNSANTATATCFKDTTITDDGTRILVNVMGSDPNGVGVGVSSSAGGVIERTREFILKQNEDYIVKFTSGIDNARVSNCFEFYEV